MAKPNFQFEKRQKELEKKRKNEEKLRRKLEKKAGATAPAQPETDAEQAMAEPAAVATEVPRPEQ